MNRIGIGNRKSNVKDGRKEGAWEWLLRARAHRAFNFVKQKSFGQRVCLAYAQTLDGEREREGERGLCGWASSEAADIIS